MSIQTYTPGPWHWRHFGSELALTSLHKESVSHIVMDFVRKGMGGAQPRFGKRTDGMGGMMMRASDILEAEWDHPDMRLIAAAPMLYEALKDVLASEHRLPSGLWEKVHAAVAEVEG